MTGVEPPLRNLRVLDFSTLLPGPLATLILAEAGAEVIKIERPGNGDEMRTYSPKIGTDSVNFAVLNRGKKSVAIDLKAADAVARLMPLIESADILVEQFRPGVMERLGLGYESLSKVNPRLIWCSITGYGSAGSRAQAAGHDLNYVAETGLLDLVRGSDGAPALPFTPIADIAGGSYPAVMNILLALIRRAVTGRGARIEIAMTDMMFALPYWALPQGLRTGQWPEPGRALTTGGSPRYHIYRCADGRFLAAAPLEQKFWQNFCRLIGLAPQHVDDSRDPAGTIGAVAAIVASRDAAHWQARFSGEDVCCAIVATLAEAVDDAHFRNRGLFDRKVASGGQYLPALHVPVAADMRVDDVEREAPALGAHNAMLAGRR